MTNSSLRKNDIQTARFVSYLRVSTQKQGAQGLGIEAQRNAVAEFLQKNGGQLLRELVEVESGKRRDRLKLEEAIALCRAFGARLLVSKLDRLSREAGFMLSLRDSGVDFVAADNPHANRLTVGVLALVAEQEREAISTRTKEALAAAKARGKQLGAYRDGVFVGRKGDAAGAAKARAVRMEQSRVKANHLRFLVEQFDPRGLLTLKKLAERLNDEGVPTMSGRGTWSPATVRSLKLRLEEPQP